MAAAQARAEHLRSGRRVRILGANRQVRWHELWDGLPYIAAPGDHGGHYAFVMNGPGHRPYIEKKRADRWIWRAHHCEAAEMRLRPEEQRFAAALADPGIVVEPGIKARASPNKDWGWARWQTFARLAADAGIRLTQLGERVPRLLPGAHFVYTPSMRYACAVLSRARCYVGHEGGLHHAAAALGRPAVVIFGGFISPAQTGYDGHRNLFTGGKPCGARQACEHCARAMAAIEPRMLLDELEAALVSTPGHLAA